MTEQTAAGACAEIEAAHTNYMTELKQTGEVWETAPAVGEGEAAWSARQVAEHIAGSNLYFGAGIAEAIGVDGPKPARAELLSATDAAAKTLETHSAMAAVAAQVTDEQMAMEIDHPRLGKQTVGSVLGILSYHYNDHASQLKSLRS